MNKNKKILIAAIAVIILIIIGFFFIKQNNKDNNNNNTVNNNEITNNNGVNNNNINNQSDNNNSINNENNIDNENNEEDTIAKMSCPEYYNQLLDKHRGDYAGCFGDKVDNEYTCSKNKNNLALIIDSSGSMVSKINGKTKLNIAKEAISSLIDNLNKNLNFSTIVYGHKGGNTKEKKPESCKGIDVLSDFNSPLNKEDLKAKINNLKPTGWTPIADSLTKTSNLFKTKTSENDNNIIILISDGEETCDGSPIQIAKKLAESDKKITIHVVGFDVMDKAEEQLKNIADKGNGKYFSAKNSTELKNALKELTKISCATKEDAWGKGFSASLSSYLECGNKIGSESSSITLDASLHNEKCEKYVKEKQKEREEQLRQKLEEANKKNEEKLKTINPTSDDPFFNDDVADEYDKMSD